MLTYPCVLRPPLRFQRMQVQSSSPRGSHHLSSSNDSSKIGHVPLEDHTRRAVPEDAIVQLASAFIRHALINLQPRPKQPRSSESGGAPFLLLEYGAVRRPFCALGKPAKLVAVPGGEINLLPYCQEECCFGLVSWVRGIARRCFARSEKTI